MALRTIRGVVFALAFFACGEEPIQIVFPEKEVEVPAECPPCRCAGSLDCGTYLPVSACIPEENRDEVLACFESIGG